MSNVEIVNEPIVRTRTARPNKYADQVKGWDDGQTRRITPADSTVWHEESLLRAAVYAMDRGLRISYEPAGSKPGKKDEPGDAVSFRFLITDKTKRDRKPKDATPATDAPAEPAKAGKAKK